MFGSLGVPELLLIFAVILIVFGPRRIPEIGRTLGKAMGEFRKATDDLKNTIEREVRLEELKQIAPPTMAEFTTPFQSISRTEPAVASPADAVPPAGVVESSGRVDESSSLRVDESSSLQVDESSSLQVVEEQTQPELSTAVPLEEHPTQQLSASVPLDDSATRRLDDSTSAGRDDSTLATGRDHSDKAEQA